MIFFRVKWNGIGNDDDDDDQNKSKGIAEGNGSVEYIYLFISSSLTTHSPVRRIVHLLIMPN